MPTAMDTSKRLCPINKLEIELSQVNTEMIRKVRIQDATDIVAIYNRYIVDTTITFDTEPVSVDEMRNRIHDIASCFPYFVYEHQGRVVGYAYVHQWKERAAYARTLETTVYLSPDAFHSGIGTTLMQHVIDECRSLGYRVLIACITAENTGSLEFHKSLGFTQVSFFHNVGEKFGRLLDVIDMELQL